MSVAKKILMGIGDEDYEIEQSAMFDPNAHLSRNVGSASNRKTWTWSAWVKRTVITTSPSQSLFMAYDNSSESNSTWLSIDFRGSNNVGVVDRLGIGQWNQSLRITSRLFRDTSAWYHIVVALDTTQSTAGDRIKVYVNGVEETSFTQSNDPGEDDDLGINAAQYHMIGAWNYSSAGAYFNGYQAEVHFVDGSQLTPSSFGKTNSATGQWVPKKYTGSHGTNGFYLKFVSGALGTDSSGEGNNYTTANFGNHPTNMYDSPTANYCTINPLDDYTTTYHVSTLTAGNLILTSDSSSDLNKNHPSIVPTSGKWYYEVKLKQLNLNGGLGYIQIQGSASSYIWSYYNTPTTQIVGNSTTYSISNWSVNDVIQVAIDFDNRKVWYGLNGTWYNTGGTANPATGADAADDFAASSIGVPTNMRLELRSGTGTNILEVNYGQKGNWYSPPTGFKALSTANLPTPTIKKSTDHFNAVLWEGSGSADQDISGVGFQPDMAYIKNRAATNGWPNIQDAVRGAGKTLFTNSTDSQYSYEDYFGPFQSDGYRLAEVSSGHSWNTASTNYVGWNWKANGSGSTDTSGDVDATVSANATAGFSIVKWEGDASNAGTVPHGLSSAPKIVIYRRYDATANWVVWTTVIDGSSDYLLLEGTSAKGDIADTYSDSGALPSSTMISNYGFGSGNDVIAYCFAEVEGYSKYGSYEANNSSDGPFIYTDFTPAWLMIKYADGAGESWWIYDNKRNSAFNLNDDVLYANLTAAEASSGGVDFLSNGFKLRATSGGLNSANTYIYMALASSPFKYSNAR